MSLKYSSIVEAIKANDLNEVKNMVENGYPFDRSSIYTVVVKGLLDILQFYLSVDTKKRIDEMEKDVISYITYAATDGHLEIVKYLHQLGFKLKSSTIEMAAFHNHIDIVKYCIENGCRPLDNDITSWGAGNFEILKYCIENGCHYDKDYILAELEELEEGKNITNVEKDKIAKYIFSLNKDSMSFSQRQYEYQSNLDKKDKIAIKMYTGNPFFRALNAFEQGTLDISLLSTEWKEDVNEYCKLNNYSFNTEEYTLEEFKRFCKVVIQHINNIIVAAPEIIEPTIIYRGVKTPYFVYDYKKNRNDRFLHKGFISTTTVFKRACHYAENKYMMRATLLPKTKCLFYPAEKEIVLPLNTKMRIVRKCVSKDFKGVYVVEFETNDD
jgi:hypothetical protein